jgi:hypothetical protein
MNVVDFPIVQRRFTISDDTAKRALEWATYTLTSAFGWKNAALYLEEAARQLRAAQAD